MTPKIPPPTQADLLNKKVAPRHWRKDQRYSRLVVKHDGYEFVYDQQDTCWRRLDRPKQTEKKKAPRTKLTPQQQNEAYEKRKAANRARSEQNAKRKKFRKNFSEGLLKWLSINWFRSRYGILALLSMFVINAMFLPAYPIIAFAIGGTLSYIGLALTFSSIKGGKGNASEYVLLIIFGSMSLVPFFAMWALHGIFVTLFRVL